LTQHFFKFHAQNQKCRDHKGRVHKKALGAH
jgi:hypothetical protein